MPYNKLGKTELTNNIKLLEKEYTVEDFFHSLKNLYSENVSYSLNEIVSYDGKLYVSKIENNLNHTPSVNSDYWQDISDSDNILSSWDINKSYKIGTLVIYEGSLYSSLISNNIGNYPNEPLSTKWQLFRNSLTWDSTVYYNENDFVSWKQTLYFSLSNNNQGNNPENSPEYWEIFSEYGSKVEALLIDLNGMDYIGDYEVNYDNENYLINIKHNLNGRVNGILYDERGKQAFYGLDYVNDNEISIQLNENAFPSEESVWKLGICLGSGFSIRMLNYDDTFISNRITNAEKEISLIRKELNSLTGGMTYIGTVDLSEYTT